MPKPDLILQAQMNELTDAELAEVVGSLHEQIKRLAEAKKADEEIRELLAKVKELTDRRYGVQIKVFGRRLCAAREVARTRGLRFNVEN